MSLSLPSMFGRRQASTAAKLVALLAMLVGTLVVLAAPARADVGSNGILKSGSTLKAGQSVPTSGGQIVLAMQTDGNLVLYAQGQALWAISMVPNTKKVPGSTASMLANGNLVVQHGTSVVWQSKTAGHPGAYATVHTDGNLAVHTPNGVALWQTKTYNTTLTATHTLKPNWTLVSPSRVYTLIMQTDGNLVLYKNGTTTAVWYSNIAHKPGATVTMQADGNLVLYYGSSALWKSATSGNSGSKLVLQNDGNAIVYSASGSPLHPLIDVKTYAQQQFASHGWNVAAQFPSLNNLWNRESGWRWNATNPSSGAYGIPQSLPGSKMATVAADWKTNPDTQILWGLKYIASVYGSPVKAWQHSQATGWY